MLFFRYITKPSVDENGVSVDGGCKFAVHFTATAGPQYSYLLRFDSVPGGYHSDDYSRWA